MTTFLLVVHLLITVAMVTSILLQRSEGGGLVGSATGFMTARGSANFMTRLTAILATGFIVLSLILAVLAGTGKKSRSILDQQPTTNTEAMPQTSTPSAHKSQSMAKQEADMAPKGEQKTHTSDQK